MNKEHNRNDRFRYSVLCVLEKLPENYPVTLRGDIETIASRAAAAGAEAVELHIRDPLGLDAEELKRAARNIGISFAAITTGLELIKNGLSLIDDDEEIRKQAVQRLKEHIDLAECIGCPAVVIGIMRSNIPDFSKYDEYEGRLTEAILKLSDYAEGKPVDLLIEAINRYVTNYLCSVPETLSYIEKLDRPNIRIHIDTHQMNIEDTDFAAAIKACGEKLAYVHLSDNNRALPGGGNIDFLSIFKALREISYNGFITVEGVQRQPGDEGLINCIKMLRGLENDLNQSSSSR